MSDFSEATRRLQEQIEIASRAYSRAIETAYEAYARSVSSTAEKMMELIDGGKGQKEEE